MTDRKSSTRKRMADAGRRVLEPLGYGIGLPLYRLGIRIAALGGGKARLLNGGLNDSWHILREGIAPEGGYIWIHCASLGEFEQGRTLIERLKTDQPEKKILLTFFSPSGYEVRKNYPLADLICYLPLDVPGAAARFLDIVRPSMAIFVKYELWRGYLKELSRRGIPSYLISALFRKDQAFFRKRSSWYAGWLRWLTHIYVQNEESRILLAGIGLENVTVAGDTRFDRVAHIRDSARRIDVLERFVGKKSDRKDKSPVFIAGSSWPADEAVYAPWLNEHKEVKAIIAPHEFDKARLNKLKQLFGGEGEAVLKSEMEQHPEAGKNARVLIIDCFGLLSSAYAYADIAYVGGGFGVGIHNINEAAAWGIPVIYGPNHHRFAEAEDLKANGGGIAVASARDFTGMAERLRLDTEERERRGKSAGNYISAMTGATDIIYHDLFRKK